LTGRSVQTIQATGTNDAADLNIAFKVILDLFWIPVAPRSVSSARASERTSRSSQALALFEPSGETALALP